MVDRGDGKAQGISPGNSGGMAYPKPINIGTEMGIVADNETAVKNAVMDITLAPLANLANLMGWGWAGGCNSWVGGGMDRTDNGWQAHFDGCGGYMSDVRLGIDYADWSFNLVNIIWG